MKKYFNFKGTISGNEYFLRPLVMLIPFLIVFASAFVFPGNGSEDNYLPFILIVIPIYLIGAWLGLSTINKRLNAFFTDNHKIAAWICMFVPYIGTALSLYLWFANGTYPVGMIDETKEQQ